MPESLKYRRWLLKRHHLSLIRSKKMILHAAVAGTSADRLETDSYKGIYGSDRPALWAICENDAVAATVKQ